MRLIIEACQSAPTYVRLLDATATIANGQWTHVALVRSNGTYTLYQNGQVAGNSTVTAGANLTQSTVYLGANESGGESFLGTLDDVRITRGVARYTAAFTPPGAIPTVDWYAPAVIAGQVSLLPPGTTFAPYPPPVAAPVPQREDRLLAGGRHLYFGGRGRIAGTVKEKGTPDRPVARRVRLFRDLDAHCVGETWSDAVTGSYVFDRIDPTVRYSVLASITTQLPRRHRRQPDAGGYLMLAISAALNEARLRGCWRSLTPGARARCRSSAGPGRRWAVLLLRRRWLRSRLPIPPARWRTTC